MSSKIRSVQLVKSLLTLTDYLYRIRELENREPIFLWDFEMIAEAIRPAQATSVYSGILWFGLESIREAAFSDRAWRIVVPEGSRTELKQELENIRERYKTILDRPEPHIRVWKESSDPGLQQFDIAGYKEITPYVERLSRLDQGMAYLLLLLRSYARPMPLPASAVPDHSVRHYDRLLNRRRPDRSDQNHADALNLASAHLLHETDEDDRTAPILVTATSSVLSSNGQIARDPMFFALTALILKEFPDWEVRDRSLRKMISRLWNIISAVEEQIPGIRDLQLSDDVEIAFDELQIRDTDERVDLDRVRQELDILPSEKSAMAGRTHRGDVEHFKAAVEHLKKDGVLVQVAELMAQATQAAKNARFQSEAIADDLKLLRQTAGGGGLLELIDHLVDSFEGTADLPAEGLTWCKRMNDPTGRMVDLMCAGKQSCLQGERLRTGIAVAWNSFDSLGEFCGEAIKLCHELGFRDPLTLMLRLPDRSESIGHTIESLSSLQETLRKLTDTKIALLRLDLDGMRLWFDPGDMYFNTENPASWRQTRLAFHVYREELCTSASTFIARTSAFALNGPTTLKACRELWQTEFIPRSN